MQISANDFVRFFVRIGKVAGALFLWNAVGQKTEGENVRFAVLFFENGKIYAFSRNSCRRTRFESFDVKSEFDKACRKFVRRLKSVGPRGPLPFARDNAAVKINARRDNYRNNTLLKVFGGAMKVRG